MAQRIAENTWQIQGRTVTLPVAIRDSLFAAAVFSCSADAARRVVADERLTPMSIAGRGLASLMCVKYRDSDLDAYDEVGLMVAVRGPVRGAIGAYTVELPVSQTFTLEAGRAIWALPKWLARSTVSFHRSGLEVRLCDGAEFVLTAALNAGGLRIPVPITAPVPCWTVGPDAGELHHGTFRIRLENLRIRLGGARLVLGEHRMARTARALGMSGPPLCTVVAKMTAELGALPPLGGHLG
ncbi:MAG: acetoacetate decarboxylase family protein [Pseudonocardiales bacterium]|nr:acetoacetate decarboxylase family protein [Pseudonocardiales bacterium]